MQPNLETQCEKEKKKKKRKENPSPKTQWKGMEKRKEKRKKPLQPNIETDVKRIGKKRRKKKKRIEKGVSQTQRERQKKKKKRRWRVLERVKGLTVGPSICVYLQKCHHNFVSITWKNLKCVFNFHNSSLKNKIIKWWKQNLKTNPNKLSLHRSHHFWVMSDGNKVMSNENTKTKQLLSPCHVVILLIAEVSCKRKMTPIECSQAKTSAYDYFLMTASFYGNW